MKANLLSDERVALGAGLLLLALVLLVPLALLAQKHAWAQARLQEIEPRFARLLGLQASRPELESALDSARAVRSQHAYPPTSDASRAGNDAQQRARDLFTKSGLEVVSTQVLPARQDPHFERIPIVVRLEGELVSLQSAMVVLPTLAPSLFVEGFTVQTIGAVRPEVPQKLSIQFNLFVLKARS